MFNKYISSEFYDLFFHKKQYIPFHDKQFNILSKNFRIMKKIYKIQEIQNVGIIIPYQSDIILQLRNKGPFTKIILQIDIIN